jgi:hypothetical protein
MNGTVKVFSYVEYIFGCLTKTTKGSTEIIIPTGEDFIRSRISRSSGMVGSELTRSIALRTYFVAVPSNEEISFILEILNNIVSPALDKLEALLPTASSWDGIARNDFCRCAEVTPLAGLE